MATITFMPLNLRVTYEKGENVFAVGQRHGVGIQTACVGKATCGLCRVRVVAGESALSPLNEHEQKHLGNVYYLTKERLSCQAQMLGGDVIVEVVPARKSGKK